jgi:hypothetical protein
MDKYKTKVIDNCSRVYTDKAKQKTLKRQEKT